MYPRVRNFINPPDTRLHSAEVINLKKPLDDTTLRLEIERGKLEPMVTPSMDMTFEKSQNKQKTDESKFTIVLDKERGIYKI